ncbi:MAG TPA: zf-HC2 domain-containing protein [Acidobacteriaceae bacterium]|nr:zf-HC2 domain-containing protein [Acidobacteriaceae bacterium]
MLHTQIEHEEVVERYVRNQLAPEDRQAFEEHYFTCDECFEKVEAMERLVAGVQELARRGELGDTERQSRAPYGWLWWAFAGTSLAMMALAVATGWAFLYEIPTLKRTLIAYGATPPPQQSSIVTISLGPMPEANVPLAMLQATRGEQSTTAALPADARQLILWVELGATRYRSYRMEIDSPKGQKLLTIDGLSRGPYGALAASIPTKSLQPGVYRVKLVGQTPPPASLVSEYRLRILKP